MPEPRLPLIGLLLLAFAAGCGASDPLGEVRALQEKRQLAASLQPLRALVEERPDDAEVQYRYGVALLATGQSTLSLWPLRRAAESPEWETLANLALSSAYRAAGSHDRAIEMADLEVQRDPESIPALTLRSEAYVTSRRHYAEALADVDRILELEPDNTSVLATRAIALLALGREDEAAEAIETLESPHRDETLGLHGSPGFCHAQAKFAEEKGDVELAAERYSKCLEQFPANGGLIQDAMAFFEGRGEPERATELLRAALEAQPESQAIRLALATRLRALGEKGEAEALLRAGTELESAGAAAESWAALARFLIDEGRHSDAVGAFREVQRLSGPDDLLLFATADALVLADQLDEAAAVAEEISQEPYRQFVLGRVALQRGEPALARHHFGEGIRAWPNHATARYYAALAAEQLGDFDSAIDDYRYAMRIDARATDAYLRLARLQEAAGRVEDALATLRFMAGGRPLETEAALLELRLLARQGRAAQTPQRLLLQLADPADRGAAAAALGAGVGERSGPEDAIEVIRAMDGLDLLDPAHAEGLAALVDQLIAKGEIAEAGAELDRALEARPEAAVFHSLRGRWLVRGGGNQAKARAAYERALELDADGPEALLGLAELEAMAGAHEAALARFQRALELDPTDRRAAQGAGAALVVLGRSAEAEEIYAELLLEHPYASESALALAELRLARGVKDGRTRELARRAVLFGGGEVAERLLERLRSAGGPGAGEAAAG